MTRRTKNRLTGYALALGIPGVLILMLPPGELWLVAEYFAILVGTSAGFVGILYGLALLMANPPEGR